MNAVEKELERIQKGYNANMNRQTRLARTIRTLNKYEQALRNYGAHQNAFAAAATLIKMSKPK